MNQLSVQIVKPLQDSAAAITVVSGRRSSGAGGDPHEGPGSQGPWRDNFMDTPFERNHRVPAIVRWPGKSLCPIS